MKKAFLLTRALPSGVRGPVDFRAFWRFASICLMVGMESSFSGDRVAQGWAGRQGGWEGSCLV